MIQKSFHENAVATANGTQVLVAAYNSVGLQLTGTFVGTTIFEGSIGGGEWVAVQGINRSTGEASTTATAAGFYVVPITGFGMFRVRISAYTSGTITVNGVFGHGLTGVPVDVSGNVIATLAAGNAHIGEVAAILLAGNADIGNVVATLAAGNESIGEVTANLAAGTKNIGDVDVLSVPATELHLGGVGGSTILASDSYTRPDNVTQYAAGDQVADDVPSVLEFAVSRVAGGTGVIIHASCTDSANVAVKPSLRLYLFDTEPTIVADNVAWTPTDADLINIVGYVEFTAWEVGLATVGAGGNCVSLAPDLQIPFDCTNGVIYGLLVVRNAYIPVTGEMFTIKLGVLQD